jgi:hypothetical protein
MMFSDCFIVCEHRRDANDALATAEKGVSPSGFSGNIPAGVDLAPERANLT